ncbi:hypothetical protein BH09MYX1_BH09MYX1_14140 [soil metagenome]
MSFRGKLGYLVVPFIAVGCTSGVYYRSPDAGDGGLTPKDSSTPSDSGTKDTSVQPGIDAGNCNGSGLTGCTPQSTCGFSPAGLKPNTYAPGACTSQDVAAFYTACINPGDSTACQNLSSSKPNCTSCLLTQGSASTAGAVVEGNGLVTANIAGCFKVKGNTTCANAVESHSQCTKTACEEVCPVSDNTSFTTYQKCLTDSDATNCKSYASAATSCDQDTSCTGSDFQGTYTLIANLFCVTGK